LRSLLTERAFAPQQIFLDVDGIEPGEDFVDKLEAQVEACDVMLCVIGQGWLKALDRLAQPTDYVRIEIASALAKGKKIVPLLLDAAQLPPADALPAELRRLTRRQAAWLRHDHFKSDLQALVPILEKALPGPPRPTPQPVPPPASPRGAAETGHGVS